MTLLKSLLYTIIFIVFLQVITLWDLLDLVFGDDFKPYNYFAFVNGFLVLIPLMFYIKKTQGFQSLKPAQTSLYFYPVAFILGVGFIFMQMPLNGILNIVLGIDRAIFTSFQWSYNFHLNHLGFFLFTPIAEELFFRQIIQKGLQQRYSGWIAILMSSALFALMHLQLIFPFLGLDLHWHHAYITFFGGLISAYLYQKSNSIGPSIVFHVAWNFSGLIF
ncbi:CPBP family intramembrane glutamic endopeptidase [Croceimicrobium sp.]|uniref:CPBP family intramembrane glutamic endopeptidase n=1 Tax=Croceimicrobium sp. TaxID=2828340 RepID=UPI003BAB1B80